MPGIGHSEIYIQFLNTTSKSQESIKLTSKLSIL